MIDDRIVKKVLHESLLNGGEFAELFVEDSHTTSIVCEDNRIEEIVTGRDVGAGIRVIFDMRSAYAYTNDLTEQNLTALARRVRNAVRLAPDEEDIPAGIVIDLTVRKPIIDMVISITPDTIDTGKKIGLVRDTNEGVRGFDKRVRQAKIIYSDGSRNILIANSEGLKVEDERIGTLFMVQVVAADKGIIQSSQESIGGFIGFELFDTEPAEEVAKKAAHRAVMMLEAERAPAGEMTVVLSSEGGGTMIHEAVGHGLEGDFIQQGLSVYSGRTGEMVASPLITVEDDATLPNKRGSFRFDDEGTYSERTVLVEEGVLRGFMYDRLSAMKGGVSSTGNGRRMSYRCRPIPRMTNTFITAGRSDPQEIIESTPKGLFVKKMGGGEVNIVNGDFVFEVSEAYIIENGKIKEAVRGATLTGNGPAVLKEIDMVGNDLGFGIGTCGKDGQGAPVSHAQPTLRIPRIVIGGGRL